MPLLGGGCLEEGGVLCIQREPERAAEGAETLRGHEWHYLMIKRLRTSSHDTSSCGFLS